MTTPEPAPSARTALIRWPTFDIVRRGFDKQQVLDYSARVVDMVQDLEKELDWMRSWAEEAGRRSDDHAEDQDGAAGDEDSAAGDEEGAEENVATEADPYQAMSSQVAEVLRALDRDVKAGRREADRDVKARRREAETEAEDIVGSAKAEADQILADARAALAEERAAATESVQRADAVAAEILREVAEVRDRLLDTVQELEHDVKVLEERPEVTLPDDAVEGEPSPVAAAVADGDGAHDGNGRGKTRSDDLNVVDVPTLQPVPEMPAGSVWSTERSEE